MKRKEIIETLLFVLPYVAVELTTMILIIIDKSILFGIYVSKSSACSSRQ